MAIHTHTHTTDHTAPVVVRSGYRTYDGAHRWMRTHEAPSGHCYGAQATPGTDTYEIVCDTIDGQSDGTVPTPLATRYGVPITTVDASTSFVGTSDGYGYAAPMPGHDTFGAPTVPTNDATPTFDDDMAPVRLMVADTTPQAPGADMTPYTTYDGTTSLARWIDGTRCTCTDYTAISGGGIITRTYAYDDGTYVTTRTDANHAWVTDDATGDTITYVSADHTYYRMAARDLDATLVTSVSWAKAGAPTCNHSYAGYGACIAPFGHTHTEHIDAFGNEFSGRRHNHAYQARTYGPVAPATYRTVVTRVPMHLETYRTVLRDDVAAMVNDYRTLLAAFGRTYRTDGQAYAALVNGMAYDTYEPAAIHYPAYSDTLDAHYAIV